MMKPARTLSLTLLFSLTCFSQLAFSQFGGGGFFGGAAHFHQRRQAPEPHFTLVYQPNLQGGHVGHDPVREHVRQVMDDSIKTPPAVQQAHRNTPDPTAMFDRFGVGNAVPPHQPAPPAPEAPPSPPQAAPHVDAAPPAPEVIDEAQLLPVESIQSLDFLDDQTWSHLGEPADYDQFRHAQARGHSTQLAHDFILSELESMITGQTSFDQAHLDNLLNVANKAEILDSDNFNHAEAHSHVDLSQATVVSANNDWAFRVTQMKSQTQAASFIDLIQFEANGYDYFVDSAEAPDPLTAQTIRVEEHGDHVGIALTSSNSNFHIQTNEASLENYLAALSHYQVNSEEIDYQGLNVVKDDQTTDSKSRYVASMVMDFLPFIGTTKAIAEFALGYDPITGEAIHPVVAGVGVGLAFVPVPGSKIFGKYLTQRLAKLTTDATTSRVLKETIEGPSGNLLERTLEKAPREFKGVVNGQEIHMKIPDLAEAVWDMDPKFRGEVIENVLAKEHYKAIDGWGHIGKQMNGKFPLIDFQKGTDLVSVKTVDLTSPTWKYRVSDYVRGLSKAEGYIEDVPGKFVLDLYIRKGDKYLLDDGFLNTISKNSPVTINVMEF